LSRLLVLGSASPRRADLLRRAGIPFEVRPTDTDETVLVDEDALAYVRRVARAKAAAAARLAGPLAGGATSPAFLTADTTVALQGRILGKPRDPAEAVATLTLLSGRAHHVHTAVALHVDGRTSAFTRTTTVHFRPLTAADIARYVATGEPMDKAGAYGIQGLGGALVDRIVGSYTNVVGLPLHQTLELLARHGILPADTGPA